VIRLMTIHQAKGQEFPLVVVADLDRAPMLRSPMAALDAELGPLVSIRNGDEEEKAATGMSLFAERERGDELEERKRLLYVACTRARDFLILSSSLASIDKPGSDWTMLLAQRFDLESGALRTQLPHGFPQPNVRVLVESQSQELPVGGPRGPNLARMLDEARVLAAAGQGIVPAEVAPIAVDESARRQFSISRLSGRLVRPRRRTTAPDPESPDDEKIEVDPRGLGTLVHAVLERVDLSAAQPQTAKKREPPVARVNVPSIRAWCELLAPDHVEKSVDEAAAQAAQMIERFVASPRGRQLAAAAKLHRELEFMMPWPINSVGGANDGGLARGRGGLYLRGFLDCLYCDDVGGWRLVDYKTGDLGAAECAAAVQQYEMQLYVYALAAELALGTAPTELVVCFLQPGVEQVLAWDNHARRRCVEMVDAVLIDLIGAETAAGEFT
jgi:ATP-dependent helicase/nuclease subunit A